MDLVLHLFTWLLVQVIAYLECHSPILLQSLCFDFSLISGISGASDENYILHLVREAMESGYRAAVFNYRGLGGLRLKTPRLVCKLALLFVAV